MLELRTGQPVPAETYAPILSRALATLPSILLGRSVDPERTEDVAKRYSPEDFASASEAMSTAIGDCGFISLGNQRANRILRQYVDDVYSYEFDAPHTQTPWPPVSFPYGSCHTKDLQYLFPGFRGGSGLSVVLDRDDLRLASTMVHYWATFAHRGTPNSVGANHVTWNKYDPVRDNVMLLTIPECAEIEHFGIRHHCSFWDEISDATTSAGNRGG